MTPTRASISTAQIAWREVAPNENTCWRKLGSTPITAAMVKPATSGKEMIVWATIIAPGVNKSGINDQESEPRGPLRDNRI